MTSQQSSSAVVALEISADDMETIMASLEAESAIVSVPVVRPPDTTSASAKVATVVPFVRAVSPIQVFITAETLKDDVHIDINDLDTVCVEHASKFVHYANIKAKARAQFEKMKAAFEILESRIYAHCRLTAAAAGGKTTEAMIDAAVKADPRWWGGKCRVIEAQGVYDLAGNAASAFEQRRDMIVQIGSDRRNERKGQVRIVEQNRETVLQHLQTQAGGKQQ